MTNEKMLKIMYAISHSVPEETTAGEYAADAIKELKEDIRSDLQKKKGNTKRNALLKKLHYTIAREGIKGYHKTSDGLFAFVDGYRAYALRDNYGFDAARDYFNVEQCKPKPDEMVKVSVDRVDLEAYIKDCRAKGVSPNKVTYTLKISESEEIYFSAVFLDEFVKMFDTDYIMCKGQLAPALYEAENGEWGILLPVRRKVVVAE